MSKKSRSGIIWRVVAGVGLLIGAFVVALGVIPDAVTIPLIGTEALSLKKTLVRSYGLDIFGTAAHQKSSSSMQFTARTKLSSMSDADIRKLFCKIIVHAYPKYETRHTLVSVPISQLARDPENPKCEVYDARPEPSWAPADEKFKSSYSVSEVSWVPTETGVPDAVLFTVGFSGNYYIYGRAGANRVFTMFLQHKGENIRLTLIDTYFMDFWFPKSVSGSQSRSNTGLIFVGREPKMAPGDSRAIIRSFDKIQICEW